MPGWAAATPRAQSEEEKSMHFFLRRGGKMQAMSQAGSAGDESQVTLLLGAIGRDEHAPAQLLEAVYGELRAMARQRLRNERPGHTLQATALVHEAYLKLIGQASLPW